MQSLVVMNVEGGVVFFGKVFLRLRGIELSALAQPPLREMCYLGVPC